MQDLDNDVLEYLLRIGALRPEERRLEAMRARAEALRGQEYQSGRTVGGHYVPPSRLQNFATLASHLAGAYGDYKADRIEEDLQKRRRAILDDFTKRARRGVNPAVDYSLLYGSTSDEPGY